VACSWGCIILVIKYCQKGPKELQIWPEVVFISLLWWLGFFKNAILLGLGAAWVNTVDLDIINELANAKIAADGTYALIMVISYVWMFFHASRRLDSSFVGLSDKVRPKTLARHRRTRKLTFQAYQGTFLLLSLAVLGLRSMIELIIAACQGLNTVDTAATAIARDVLYQLSSAVFALSIMACGVADRKTDDLALLETEAEDAVRHRILKRITAATAHNTVTAPALETIFQEVREKVEAEPDTMSRSGTLDETERLEQLKKLAKKRMKLRYIKKLGEHFQDWEPIQRWTGPENLEDDAS